MTIITDLPLELSEVVLWEDLGFLDWIVLCSQLKHLPLLHVLLQCGDPSGEREDQPTNQPTIQRKDMRSEPSNKLSEEWAMST